MATNTYRSTDREKAFEKRYGKKTECNVTWYAYENGTIKTNSNHFKHNNRDYFLTEELAPDGNTDHVILKYLHGDRTIENKFSYYLDAEVTLSDLMSEN